MYIDNNLVVAGGVSAAGTITYQTPAVTINAVTLSTNTVDLGIARDMGEGCELFLRAQIGTAFAGLTTLEIQAITADDAALTTNVTVISSTGAIPLASLVAGSRFAASLNPRLTSKGQRYLGARFVVAGTGSAGTAFVDFGEQVQDGQKFYPNGFATL